MKIFVSHALTDKDLISKLNNSLKPYGITLLVAEHYVSMTSTITEKIEGMIDTCDAALILLTQNGFNSNFVNQEIGYIKKAKKLSFNVIEKGLEDKITGFIYGHDYITYDPAIPNDSIVKITNRFVAYYKKLQKVRENQINQKILIGLGVLVGALFFVASEYED